MEWSAVANNDEVLTGIAQQLIAFYPCSRIFAFTGAMGAGKTTFIKALCAVLGVDDVVTSPTFALVNVYSTRAGEAVYHFDLYRIQQTSELFDIGYEEYVYSGNYCFIEWPGKMMELLPQKYVHITITEQPDQSRLFSAQRI
ncbi:MAG: tRNA (adenosine(37)-N6)-threonylcarbamoyltransferase complex ATPase subunit type 1 TsaE [Bacteroidia bacterium]|nr:tRNA (adenosine(37)-N6)-threonylcarbamoyltransferase complex ATPase subunit type 1 TsaE [Bacteroidales bacterium]NCD41678.1 tRNA (adenosine(37)-N6)-threonylcarbamoyltransferase complex ATPase subunit type 1 TsaE [Bacteroidia bacterium]MDD2323461.1 tRNA (adenosine(37)-N6)-threonylcarbamoyltransferase complex ATPase subunit type 1 TsaE [Bacteroidales bacterium]MDD3010626.1 tRNA (adenosine(37)-N6)-threonylcarbamoyltransferase complex ATPase subunit type 1 TsaE [Bacteroidales bacterium]MDD396177